MTRLRIAASAHDDLLEIWRWIDKEDPSAADRQHARFFDAFRLLAEHPQVGTSRYALGRGIRGFPVGSYLILYRLVDAESLVEVLRVVHGHRRISRLLVSGQD